jgi:2'-hydroxyisoflavone reductase
MRILILGGTVFLGRALVEVALARGHEVTLFNRGRSNPDLFPGVEKLRGDRRAGDLKALEGRSWEAVIDTCGYVPRVVRQSVELLAEKVDHYTFISTLSVYADNSRPGMDESAPVGKLDDETVEEVTGETYGPLKAACEAAAEAAVPGRVLTLRPGLIVGPHDPTDRFTYWPVRAAKGGEVLAPGRPDRPIQFIDVRDLAEWNIEMVEKGQVGLYNVIGPEQPLPMAQFLGACRMISGSDATFTWVSEAFLAAQQVTPWSEVPLWVPESDSSLAGFFTVDGSKAVKAGLAFRPITSTVEATLEWSATRPVDHQWRAGLLPEREQALLAAWAESQGV